MGRPTTEGCAATSDPGRSNVTDITNTARIPIGGTAACRMLLLSNEWLVVLSAKAAKAHRSTSLLGWIQRNEPSC
jgi:hypothetical protein